MPVERGLRRLREPLFAQLRCELDLQDPSAVRKLADRAVRFRVDSRRQETLEPLPRAVE